MKTTIFAVVVALTLSACQGAGTSGPFRSEADRSISSVLPPNVAHKQFDWADFIEPDFVPIVLRVCRSPEGTYMKWDILVTLQNQDGNLNLDANEAPIDIYVDFDPDRPYGVNNETGEPLTLEEFDSDLLRDMPDQQWMSTPRAGNFGGAAFSLWYPDGGPGSRYRRIPTKFTITLDQFRGNNPTGGTIDESDETNNGVGVIIDRYDAINGATGRRLIGCWYGSRNP
ncbi:MAG: hypothetical protein OER22_02175 [Gammaproteobacteria bacterium]|nr:hypothetical protein [Gammaproteobacteria bacterium]MDH3373054.1 hypothetical protein [Gammaproteobacteria bacterium]MDH3408934.1 hypothetical protein [Gammaproteobacteria bacterium]MDH3551401.1 hypothetical protein [Gammaproteobacteria bacterium]